MARTPDIILSDDGISVNGVFIRKPEGATIKRLSAYKTTSNNSGFFDGVNQYQVPSGKKFQSVQVFGSRQGTAANTFNIYHTSDAIGPNTATVGTDPQYLIDSAAIPFDVGQQDSDIFPIEFEIPAQRYPNVNGVGSGNGAVMLIGFELDA